MATTKVTLTVHLCEYHGYLVATSVKLCVISVQLCAIINVSKKQH